MVKTKGHYGTAQQCVQKLELLLQEAPDLDTKKFWLLCSKHFLKELTKVKIPALAPLDSDSFWNIAVSDPCLLEVITVGRYNGDTIWWGFVDLLLAQYLDVAATKQPLEKAIELYVWFCSAQHLGELRVNFVKRNSARCLDRDVFGASTWVEISNTWEQTKLWQQVAKKFGTSLATLRDWMKKHQTDAPFVIRTDALQPFFSNTICRTGKYWRHPCGVFLNKAAQMKIASLCQSNGQSVSSLLIRFFETTPVGYLRQTAQSLAVSPAAFVAMVEYAYYELSCHPNGHNP